VVLAMFVFLRELSESLVALELSIGRPAADRRASPDL